jgi:type I restriction enzyme S subunit
MKPYPKYKDSGIEWIGEVPEGWDVKKLKYSDKVIMGQSPSSDDYNDLNVGFPFLQGNADFTSLYPNPKIWCETAKKYAEKNDVLLSVRAPIGAVNIADQKYGIGRGLCAIRYIQSLPILLFYFALSLNSELKRIGTGSTYTAISVVDVENIFIPNIPPTEQKSIAAYLSHKTTQIDNLISKKQKLIELVKEERAAIINQAVTKGLNPDAPMKNSGIEWLGEIPAHWEIKKIKYLLKNKKGALKTGPFGSQLKNSDLSSEGFKVYNQRSVLDKDFDSGDSFISNEKFFELRDFEILPGDLLLTSRGTIGKCAIFPSKKIRGILHPCLIRIQFDHDLIINDYAELFIQNSRLFAERIAFNSNATTIDVIYGDTLRDVDLVFPPNIKEQNEIVMFVKKQTTKIDQTIAKIKKQTDLLQEYRTTLISEVVIGKIDVRT